MKRFSHNGQHKANGKPKTTKQEEKDITVIRDLEQEPEREAPALEKKKPAKRARRRRAAAVMA